jgi:hypothetical protein
MRPIRSSGADKEISSQRAIRTEGVSPALRSPDEEARPVDIQCVRQAVHASVVTFVQRFGGALNLNPHAHSILPDGLFIADALAEDGTGGRLRFEPLPPPTTADVEELTATIARRLMDRVAAAWEADGSDYLNPSRAQSQPIPHAPMRPHPEESAEHGDST